MMLIAPQTKLGNLAMKKLMTPPMTSITTTMNMKSQLIMTMMIFRTMMIWKTTMMIRAITKMIRIMMMFWNYGDNSNDEGYDDKEMIFEWTETYKTDF